MAIKKQYFKTKKECKVTFSLPVKAAGKAKKVSVVGDFNDWKSNANPMKKFKTGEFKTTLSLEKDKEYQFRYLIDGKSYENDWEADKYVQSPVSGEENSVVIL
ncbi:isoamylase early set domain-containing protein [Hyphobacterium sp. CCMP332]|nr:isoamylase early set domain-containing protein [Hyphobacterium sp. CCMP332]